MHGAVEHVLADGGQCGDLLLFLLLALALFGLAAGFRRCAKALVVVVALLLDRLEEVVLAAH